jgi:hypothetical protein
MLPFCKFAGQNPKFLPFLKVFGQEKFGQQKIWHL